MKHSEPSSHLKVHSNFSAISTMIVLVADFFYIFQSGRALKLLGDGWVLHISDFDKVLFGFWTVPELK